MVRGNDAGSKVMAHCVHVLTNADVETFLLQCSKSCGGGSRRRGAACRKASEAGGDESKCSQREKLTVQPCNEFLCPQWKTGDWSEVSSAGLGSVRDENTVSLHLKDIDLSSKKVLQHSSSVNTNII